MNYGRVEYVEEANMQDDWKSGSTVHRSVSQNFILIDTTKASLNIVTWGVELWSRNTIFACIPMESLFSGVLP